MTYELDTLKKEIDEAKKLKIEAENLLNEYKEKEKENTQYIEELKEQKKKKLRILRKELKRI